MSFRKIKHKITAKNQNESFKNKSFRAQPSFKKQMKKAEDTSKKPGDFTA